MYIYWFDLNSKSTNVQKFSAVLISQNALKIIDARFAWIEEISTWSLSGLLRFPHVFPLLNYSFAVGKGIKISCGINSHCRRCQTARHPITLCCMLWLPTWQETVGSLRKYTRLQVCSPTVQNQSSSWIIMAVQGPHPPTVSGTRFEHWGLCLPWNMDTDGPSG